MKNSILLVEPSFRNKYPPLGLMKLSAFHKHLGDEVVFIKGLDRNIQNRSWDRIYIATLFSFYWDITISTIRYYEYSVKNAKNLFIGGPMATIMFDEIEKEVGYKPIKGLLNEPGKINISGEQTIDGLVPDYDILNTINYKYPATDAYFTYTTRGCIRKCSFCAVPTIEPTYQQYIPLKKQIQTIDRLYGQKKDLLLLDNNILASPDLFTIIDEIIDIGFHKGAKLNNKLRIVDFNQGIDLRLITKKKLQKISQLPIKPLRIAFDSINLAKEYIKKIQWAADYGMLNLSNYILYNYKDTPEDFYKRLQINIDLNDKLGTKIFSFPMKFVPVHAKDRKYIGINWNKRYLRGIQCILNATHGIVGARKEFFEAAFGKDSNEFIKIISMPDKYILYRDKYKENGASEWKKVFESLQATEKHEFIGCINNGPPYNYIGSNNKVKALLAHYVKEPLAAVETNNE